MLVSITGGGTPPGIPLGTGGMPGGIPGIKPPTGGIPGGGMPCITIGWGGIMPIGITGIIPRGNSSYITFTSYQVKYIILLRSTIIQCYTGYLCDNTELSCGMRQVYRKDMSQCY